MTGRQAASPAHDPLGVCDTLAWGGRPYRIWSLRRLEKQYHLDLSRTPFSIKLLLESLLRVISAGLVPADTLNEALPALLSGSGKAEIPFLPARVLLQDFTGVPVLVDLAAMREAVARLGGDPAQVNPAVPVDIVVDHSILADVTGCAEALARNTELEFQRNRERYMLLRWGEQAFTGLRVFPPGTGIVHQINLEYLASVVQVQEQDGIPVLFPDSVCGTDSHTTMINGLGVLGWGVGGIEAESVMLGRPLMLPAPRVTGVKLTGRLRPGVTTTDLVLTVTERLRREGVVDQFVEFCGDGLRSLSLAERATLANMAPEYGATCAYFPVDEETLCYLRATGRPESQVKLAERYCTFQGLFRRDEAPQPLFSRLLEFDLAGVEPCVAGPFRPQDRIPVGALKSSFAAALAPAHARPPVTVQTDKGRTTLTDGAILLAAITSCTNTSNPSVMVAAGLVARNAAARGLSVPPHVKTSLSPGSLVVSDYLTKAGLMPYLEGLGFHVAGYGCMTCSGSSGPVHPGIAEAVREHHVITAAVLSGNRNFEGRIHPLVRANYLASPPLVIAYAIAGTVAIDLDREPLGVDQQGLPVYLSDIWPSDEEIVSVMRKVISPEMFLTRYRETPAAGSPWQAVPVAGEGLYDWPEGSTYIRRSPFFDDMTLKVAPSPAVEGGRVLALLGDSITTDHLSPGGAIDPRSPAGRYLTEHGVEPANFNAYGSRRGNHEVMVRGTLSNLRLQNFLVPGVEGGFTAHQPSGETMTIYDAALRYAADQTPLLIIAGKEYGGGSSRDWAAKGPRLLGVRAVIAESFERIHRSNLVCMGVLPLEFMAGESWRRLGLDGTEAYSIQEIGQLQPGQILSVEARKQNGASVGFAVRTRIDTESELLHYQHGGILPHLVRSLVTEW